MRSNLTHTPDSLIFLPKRGEFLSRLSWYGQGRGAGFGSCRKYIHNAMLEMNVDVVGPPDLKAPESDGT